MLFRLRLPEAIYQAILDHALREQPNECCGLLAGRVSEGLATVEAMFPLVNALASPTEYEAEPRGLLDAHKEIWRRELDVLAVYHSHPTSPPVPSRKDRERNFSEEVVSLIVTLMTSPPTLRGWWLTANDHREAEWEIF